MLAFNFSPISWHHFSEQIHETTIIPFLYYQRKAYVFVLSHDNQYDGAFGNFMKMQIQMNQEHSAAMMDQFDYDGALCLNDIYDEIESVARTMYEEDEETQIYDTLWDCVQEFGTQDEKVVYEFVELLEKELAQTVIYNNPVVWLVHSLLCISLSRPEFFEKHIGFDFNELERPEFSMLKGNQYYINHKNSV